MIADFNDFVGQDELRVSVCIVGAGAVGLSMAAKFANDSTVSVIVLEAGNTTPLPEPAPALVKNLGDINTFNAGSYNKGFGGSTLSWGGQILPFCSLDFSKRAALLNSGWPISHESLEPYYRDAEKLLAVDYVSFSDDIYPKDLPRPMSRHGLSLGFSKWCPQKNLAKHFEKPLLNSDNVTIILNAQVEKIDLGENDSSVKTSKVVSVVGLEGAKISVSAKSVIIAAGGLENTRLLARSNSVSSDDMPALGHYYHDHIGFYGARLTPLDNRQFNALFATKLRNSGRCLPKLALSELCICEQGTVNVNGNIVVESDDQTAISLAKSVYRTLSGNGKLGSLASDLLRLLLRVPDAARIAYSYFFKREVALPPKSSFFLLANCESVPMEGSCLEVGKLSTAKRAKLDQATWQVDDAARDSMREYYLRAKEYLETNGIAKVEINPHLFKENRDWLQDAYSLYHHMGATRMGKDRFTSVVDENCRVHGSSGLYVAGCSVLPTGSCSNPTFTAIALGLKLVDHLISKAHQLPKP